MLSVNIFAVSQDYSIFLHTRDSLVWVKLIFNSCKLARIVVSMHKFIDIMFLMALI